MPERDIVPGTILECPTEPSWPLFIVSSVHKYPEASFAGNRLRPFLAGEFSDEPGIFASLSLASVERGQWVEYQR